MNDNLRYISLQYIKGDNYDNITCFDYNEMKIFDDETPYVYNTKETTHLFINKLKRCKKDTLCNIGEKLIDDLVNFYQFKYNKTKIKKRKDEVEAKIEEVEKEINEKNSDLKSKGLNNNMNDNTIIQKFELTLKNLKNINEKKEELEEKYNDQNTQDADVLKTYNQFKKIVDNTKNAMKNYSLGDDYGAKINTIGGVRDNIGKQDIVITESNTSQDIIKNLKAEIKNLNHPSTQIIKNKFSILEYSINKPVVNDEGETKTPEEEEKIKEDKKLEDQAKINVFITYLSNEIDTFIIPYLQAFKALKDAKVEIEKFTFDDSKTKITIKNFMDTHPIDLKHSIGDLETNKGIIESLQNEYLEGIKEVEGYKSELKKVVDLLSEYYKICDENIKKYEKIFKHNDISSIDDAFMIKSYSDFLKKLNQLKENLESKDKGKIKRAFTEFVKRLINLYGLNLNKNETFQGDNLKFLIERIVNYV
jgi:hypothetical protein